MTYGGNYLLNLTYNYTAGHDNSQIANSVNAINGETVTYQYDAIQRLVSASSTAGWSSGYSYDGYGNLTGMSGAGGAPYLSTAADWAHKSHHALRSGV